MFSGDKVEYNTGVMFFDKKAEPVFKAWRELRSGTVNSEALGISFETGEIFNMSANDQAAFALAVEKTEFHPYVLPMKWNFRPMWHKSFCGPIKIWHDYADPPPFFDQLNAYYSNPDSMNQYHQG